MSPAYAYNAITVGGVDETNTGWYVSDISRYDSLAYVKPNVSAPCTVNITGFGVDSSTNYAAAIVTGCVAILMYEDPTYCIYPEKVMATVMATATSTNDFAPYENGYDLELSVLNMNDGAGIINLGGMLECINPIEIYNTATTLNESEIFSTRVYLDNRDTIQIGLSWLAASYSVYSMSMDEYELLDVQATDYELRIYNSDGNCIIKSELSNSNIEYIRVGITTPGYYSISVYQISYMCPFVTGEYLYLTYCIE